MREADKLLRSFDPGRTMKRDSPSEKDALLERILMTPQQNPPGARRGRRNLFIAVTTAACVVAVGIGLLDSPVQQSAYAATPPPLKVVSQAPVPAATVLERIARQVEHVREAAPAGGKERFVQETWSLETRIGGQQITSAVVPERRETTKDAEGNLAWSVRAKKPEFQDDEQREAWESQWAEVDEPTQVSGSEKASGEPPSGLNQMREWLMQRSPADTAGFISESLIEKSMTNHFAPKQRAAVLRVLAERKGLAYSGTAVDREGRPGVAFTIASSSTGLPAKHTIVIDEDSGKLLSYEKMLTGNPGQLKVKTPAVINYVSFLQG
ncbi:hypothetical protein ABCR94_36185 [Streptomyces sp. 21So2-11]|uniref:hypothetical protein n=1 Tax=Streptomyces sp. 21So2-11 TaxID=3144408 RepID=UPI00321A14FC